KGVAVLVDGAQSAGVFDLDLAGLEVDYYAVPGQKWLCGPEGIGALYVKPDRLDTLQPTYVGYPSFQSQDWQGGYTLANGAKRYEIGGTYPATLAGMRASLNWFRHEVTPEWAYARIAHLAAHARQAIGALAGVRLLTPENRQASLVNFLPVGWSPAQMAGLVAALAERGFIIRSIPHPPYCARLSCGFYNTEADIDGVAAALGEVLDAGPEAVTIPEWAQVFGLSNEPVR
ncbi:MAG: aminotransferase class V-fold PLP-dependent enzyme, partial [Anaerolineae bacterium]|nr:aminotransferase class V-fold PLP-dependent enzyme [Anaerolineae bacterium]